MRTTPVGQSSYRLTRRGFLAIAGTSAAAAILAACGGTTGPATQQASPAATSPAKAASSPVVSQASAAATVQAKTGGKLVIRWYTGDPPDLDPYLNVTFRSQEFAGFFYSRLLKYDSGPSVVPNSFAPVPDLAEKYDVSPDGLTYTFTIRANAK